MPFELTFSDVWVGRRGAVSAPETVIADIAGRPYLVKMTNADLMLTTTAADTAHKPDAHVTYNQHQHQQQQQQYCCFKTTL